MSPTSIDDSGTRARSTRWALAALATLAPVSAGAATPAQQTQVVSVDSSGRQTAFGDSSGQAVISDSGRFVAFASIGPDLVPGDTNGASDVFVHDRGRGVTIRVSVDSSGAQANAGGHSPGISADGRFVAFTSTATNLDPAATSGFFQVYVHDRDLDGNGVFDQDAPGARRTVLVSKDAAGTAGDADSSACGVSMFGGPCTPSISADGRFVAFASDATNLDPAGGGDRNGLRDVFVHDRDRDGNGVFDEPLGVVTHRAAFPLVPGIHPDGPSSHPELAARAPIVVFQTQATDLLASDSNGVAYDVVAWDFAADTFHLVSASSGGAQANASSYLPAVSSDGRVVTFLSRGTNLAAASSPFYADVFVRDRDVARTGVLDVPGNVATTLLTRTPGGQPAPGNHDGPAVSGDGAFVAFSSDSATLVAGDGNGATDIFHYSLASDDHVRVSLASAGAEGDFASIAAALSFDGRTVAFVSTSSNLLAHDANGLTPDVVVRECPRSDFAAATYCAGKTSSAGCLPFLTTVGCPGASDPGPFRILGHEVLPGAGATLIYGTSKASLAWHCGTLCVKPPFERIRGLAPKSHSAGCTDATLSFDFNGWIQSGADPLLTAGHTVFAQVRQDDLQNPVACPTTHRDSLTDAVRFTIGP